MLVGIPKEVLPGERRVAAIPETVAKYVKMGLEVAIETGAGAGISVSDGEYEKAGARSLAMWRSCSPRRISS